MKKSLIFTLIVFFLMSLNILFSPIKSEARNIERVSVNNVGVQGDDSSSYPSINSNGRYVAFDSNATNLVSGDTNARGDVFVYDRNTGDIERVSVDSVGVQGTGESFNPSISADGRYVAFVSNADNLVPVDTNSRSDIFVFDRNTGDIERVSVDSVGVQGNDNSQAPIISADGRYVVFESTASNLVAGDTNGASDVFVFDRNTGDIERVSVDSVGVQGNGYSQNPSISSDGRYVAFESYANNLVAGDTNGDSDVFVYDRDMHTIERVSVNNGSVQGNSNSYYPSISSDGRYVAFHSDADNLVTLDTNGDSDVFVFDRNTGDIERVSVNNGGVQGDDDSEYPRISSDGRYVAFFSSATNLVTLDTNTDGDVFVYDRGTDTIERVSVNNVGVQGNDVSEYPSISADGRYVAFYSSATNLVTGDTNARSDVFVSYTDTSPPPGGSGGSGGCFISTCGVRNLH